MQARRDECLLFVVRRTEVAKFVMQLKAHGGFCPLKPTPLQEADLRHCAEEAQCGAVTVLYGRLIAFLKHLHGVRNVAITHMQWGHIDFVRTNIRCNETQTDEV